MTRAPPPRLRICGTASLEARIDRHAWEQPAIFQWLENNGNISGDEMLRTFNCGIGLILVVEKDDATLACDILEQLGEEIFVLGEIAEGHRGVVIG